jgi:catechol-2,3-dioxygenase
MPRSGPRLRPVKRSHVGTATPRGRWSPLSVYRLNVHVSVATVTIKCRDPRTLACFWMELLGYEVAPNHSSSILTIDPTGNGPALLFQPAEATDARGDGRVHLDLRPANQAETVTIALELGAQHADVGQTGDESWVVLADPEGNHFCVLQSTQDQDTLWSADPGSLSPI